MEVRLTDGTVLLGEITAREGIPQPGSPEHLSKHRIQMKLGNRDLTGADFRWVDEDAIAARSQPADALFIERREYGPFIGRVVGDHRRIGPGHNRRRRRDGGIAGCRQPRRRGPRDDPHD